MSHIARVLLALAVPALALPGCGDDAAPATPGSPISHTLPDSAGTTPLTREQIGEMVKGGMAEQMRKAGLDLGPITRRDAENALDMMERLADAASEEDRAAAALTAMQRPGGKGIQMALLTQKFGMLAMRAKHPEQYARLPAMTQLSDHDIQVLEPLLPRFLAITARARR